MTAENLTERPAEKPVCDDFQTGGLVDGYCQRCGWKEAAHIPIAPQDEVAAIAYHEGLSNDDAVDAWAERQEVDAGDGSYRTWAGG